MQLYTQDERYLLAGVLLSALVAGTGIYELYVATGAGTETAFLGTLVIGAMLFNAGIAGVVGMCSIWYNYRAIL